MFAAAPAPAVVTLAAAVRALAPPRAAQVAFVCGLGGMGGRVGVRAGVRACGRMCGRAGVRAYVRAYVRACGLVMAGM